MEIQIWQMVVTTEREHFERRIERRARIGRPATGLSLTGAAMRSIRSWRKKSEPAAQMRPQEA